MTDEIETPDNEEEAALWNEFDEQDKASQDAEPEHQDEAADPEPEGSEEEPEAQDPWAKAPDELRQQHEEALAKLAKLEQADRSHRGRQSALQRQLDELRQQVATKPKEEVATPETPEEWEQLQEDYPEIAAPVRKMIDQQASMITRLEKELQAIGSVHRDNALQEQATLLAEEHPDWEQVGSDPGFADWLQNQPRHIQEAAYRNGNEIVDYREAADVVGRYKQFKGASNPQPNTKLADKRKAQLKSAQSTRSRGPGVTSGIPEDGDPEQLWKMWEEHERRTRA